MDEETISNDSMEIGDEEEPKKEVLEDEEESTDDGLTEEE